MLRIAKKCLCLLLYDRYCIFVHCNHHFDFSFTKKEISTRQGQYLFLFL